jgi:hypothetical protein
MYNKFVFDTAGSELTIGLLICTFFKAVSAINIDKCFVEIVNNHSSVSNIQMIFFNSGISSSFFSVSVVCRDRGHNFLVELLTVSRFLCSNEFF